MSAVIVVRVHVPSQLGVAIHWWTSGMYAHWMSHIATPRMAPTVQSTKPCMPR
jgi:hypothetical protein